MTKDALIAVAAGTCSALFLALPLSSGALGVAFLAYLSPLPLFMVGLGIGSAHAQIAAATAGLILLLVSDWFLALLFILQFAAPAAVTVELLLRNRVAPDGTVAWYPPGRLLAGLTAYPALVLASFMILFPGNYAAAIAKARELITASMGDALAPMAALVPTMAAMWWIVMISLNAALAQTVLEHGGRNLRPGLGVSGLDLPRWLGIATLVAAAASVTIDGRAGAVAQSLLMVLTVPFFFLGLATIHGISRGWSGRPMILTAIYLLIVLGWPAVLVAALGFLEHWTNLRRRFAAPGDDKEEE